MVPPNFSDDDLGEKNSGLIHVNMLNMCVYVALTSVPDRTDTFRKIGVQFISLEAHILFHFLQSLIKYGRHTKISLGFWFDSDN